MRRLLALLLLAVPMALAGCGTERPATIRNADATSSPTSAATSAPAPTPAASPVSEAGGSLAGFPLDLGYAETNGDDGSSVVVTKKPATRAFEECHRQVWDPAAGSEAIGVEFRGEAEWSRGRTLVLYPTVEAATSAVDTAADAITSCPRDGGDTFGWTEHTEVDYHVGDQSFGWIDRYWTSDVNGFDTGLTIYHAVRVGNAVLFTYEYGEGNGSEETRRSALSAAERADAPVVKVMYSL